MVEILSQQGVLRPDAEQQPSIGIARWVANFDHYLDPSSTVSGILL
jgi:hypothetical protein